MNLSEIAARQPLIRDNHIWLTTAERDTLVAVARAARDALDQSNHADGCAWWDVSPQRLASEAGRREADAKCDCFVVPLRTALDPLTDVPTGPAESK